MKPRLIGSWAAALVAVALVCAPSAAAHGEASPLVRGVVDSIEPSMPGVRFTIVKGPAALVQVVNKSNSPVEIVSIDGRPFIRIGPRGVEANVASQAWFESGNPDGVATTQTKGGKEPRWERVSQKPVWSYFEHRLHPREAELPPEVVESREVKRLDSFNIPIRYKGSGGAVKGHLEFNPVVGAAMPRLTTPSGIADGLTVTALPGRLPALYLTNTSRRTVVVIGVDGEPFARVGPKGVEINRRSPIHVESMRQNGKLETVVEDPKAKPIWMLQSASPTFAWTDPRARYGPERPPDEIVEQDEPTLLKSWSIPIQADSRTLTVRGETRWVPTNAAGVPGGPDPRSDGGPDLGLALWVAPILLVGAAALFSRRRLNAPSDRVDERFARTAPE
jgi:hypothetical protein